jgi:enamine deaminase RidA (YjgF/YER057c/UK114 family)
MTLTPMPKSKPLKMNPEPTVDTLDDRIEKMGIILPVAAAPVAAYVPTVEAGGFLHISGQLPFDKGNVMVGRIGEDRDVAFGQAAARACGLMLLAQIKAAVGSLERVERVVKLGVFINSDPRFTDQPKVANGASELMVEVFGDAGKHARAAVGVTILPLGAAVEVDAIVALRPL